MADRSFKEYINNRFYDNFFAAVNGFMIPHRKSIDFGSRVVSDVDFAELSDVKVKCVWVDDREDMSIAFDVIIEAEVYVKEFSRRYDTKEDTCYPWFLLSCSGDLSKSLDDFRIHRVDTYNTKSKQSRPLDDALVPINFKEDLESVAFEFLQKYYPEALKTPMAIDPATLAQRLGLTIEYKKITEDFSAFGQIFFADCEGEIYDEVLEMMVPHQFKAKTIVVDPDSYWLRTIGSANNTIVHECVHWEKHRKAFELERLFNQDATQIKCLVKGGTKDAAVRTAADWMEWQANTLAPKIQMPQGSFKTKAYEFISKYQRLKSTTVLVDVMEPVIEELATFFAVSRQAAKIRLIDLGFEEAIGAFTYIDGKYVKPHAFKKGSLKRNQTFCIAADDAEIIAFSDIRLNGQSQKGAYIYVDSHMCLNDAKYIERDENGTAQMTEYGRLHIDECCLAFELKVKSKDKYAEEFYKECVLFRDANSGIVFQTSFSAKASESVLNQADAILAHGGELKSVIQGMPNTFGEALKYLMKWADGITVEALGAAAQLDPKTIQRMRNNSDYPTNIESVVAVCIGMHLPPELSEALLALTEFRLAWMQKESHMLYRFFLYHMYESSVDECNKILLSKNLPILTNKE